MIGEISGLARTTAIYCRRNEQDILERSPTIIARPMLARRALVPRPRRYRSLRPRKFGGGSVGYSANGARAIKSVLLRLGAPGWR